MARALHSCSIRTGQRRCDRAGHRSITWSFGATALPGLELVRGVPTSLRTLVAVPTLLTSEADLFEQVERLEVHYLAGAAGDLTLALLTDGIDADEEVVSGDAHMLDVAAQAIGRLNARHGPGPAGARFLLLPRRRVFNPAEGKWMGWERKRGKLHELNRLLRGATDTSFITVDGKMPKVPVEVRYVITLDADTRLTRDTVIRLVGKMAHPLNRPRFSPHEQRVSTATRSYSRGDAGAPGRTGGIIHQRVFSSPGGLDPYAAAVSDVYQYSSAKAPTQARALTTSMPSRPLSSGGCRRMRFSATICSKEFPPAPESLLTSK